MHEMSLAGSVVDVVVRHAAGRPVTGVHLRIGHLRQVVPSSLEFYFRIVGRDTLCEGAELTHEVVAARLRCACGEEWEPEILWFRCPVCAGQDVSVTAGEEFEVESITVEEDAACTASR